MPAWAALLAAAGLVAAETYEARPLAQAATAAQVTPAWHAQEQIGYCEFGPVSELTDPFPGVGYSDRYCISAHALMRYAANPKCWDERGEYLTTPGLRPQCSREVKPFVTR